MREAFHIEEEDLILYSMGALKDAQLSQFTAHISMCSECRAELGRIEVDLASFATVQPQQELPEGARERFMQRLASDSAPASKFVQMRNKSRLYHWVKSFQEWLETPVPLRILSGALAAALVFTVYDDISHIHQVRQMLPEMRRFERESADFAELKDFLRGANAQNVALHEKPLSAKEPEGHAIYSPSSGRLLFTAANLPAPPVGKAYELWLIPAAGGAPIPAGVFKPNLQGGAAVVFPEIPVNVQAAGFGVTVEDAAGARTPTLPIYLSGQ